ncbi:MAG: CBS domain-containing protein [Bacteroidetes bacterium]|nr:CBS domain-containing protein [Bacteroidota bacterium]
MEKILMILARKEPHFHKVHPASKLSDAVKQMCAENVDHLIVMNDEGHFMGVLSEHDITSQWMFGSRPKSTTIVRDVMNTRLPVVNSDDTVENCMKLMRQHNIRLLPVFDGIHFKGIVSSDDILNEVVASRSKVFDTEAEDPYHYA